MTPLHTHGVLSKALQATAILKVLDIGEALASEHPREKIIVDTRRSEIAVDANALAECGFFGLLARIGQGDTVRTLHSLRLNEVVGGGDVIRLQPSGKISVLYRRGANANFLFTTERCNSRCLMCSQPPNEVDDRWRVQEMVETVALIDTSLERLGFTGGEPTLLGSEFARVLELASDALPNTQFHVLSNGRAFADRLIARSYARVRGRATWAIPVYADTAQRHDFVVQAQGAFDETIRGLHNLAEEGHTIEIRFVLHAQTVSRLAQFAEFVWRNLTFANHIALMGMEPMGFAKQNRSLLWIDPADYAHALGEAAQYLRDRSLWVSIYNVPLCVLPRNARHFARQSISDWKNIYVEECNNCDIKVDCCGFFRSAGNEWRSRSIHPVKGLDV